MKACNSDEPMRLAILERDGYACRYCGTSSPDGYDRGLDAARRTLHLDHVVPRSRGGRHCIENIVTACLECNLRKGRKLLEEVGMVLRPIPEYFARISGGIRE